MTAVRQVVDWRMRAACRGAPPALFITAGDDDDEPYYPPAEAKAYCDRCPVLTECLAFALEHKLEGTWGGTTTYQREQLARVRARAKCPGCGGTDLVAEGRVELCLFCGVSWFVQ